MARRKKGNPIHGWMIVDKPAGMTSNDVLKKIKHILQPQKVGHAGTLDPMATGVLPVAFGEATKTTSFMMDCVKSYRFTVRWGQETDTDDAQGQVTQTSDHRPTRDEVAALLPDFIGDIAQMPPAYSAIKVDGKRAYAMARQGEAVVLTPRTVKIQSFQIVDQPDADHMVFEVVCGKGTYVRALARDLGRKSGGFGHVSQLNRVFVGNFHQKDAISLDLLADLSHIAPPYGFLQPVEAGLDDIPAMSLDEQDAMKLRSGQMVSMVKPIYKPRIMDLTQGDLVCAMHNGKALAISRFEKGCLHPVRVFQF